MDLTGELHLRDKLSVVTMIVCNNLQILFNDIRTLDPALPPLPPPPALLPLLPVFNPASTGYSYSLVNLQQASTR